VSAKNCLIKDL
jgi:chromosome segregation ATPase